jgi:hypothetical protein
MLFFDSTRRPCAYLRITNAEALGDLRNAALGAFFVRFVQQIIYQHIRFTPMHIGFSPSPLTVFRFPTKARSREIDKLVLACNATKRV